MKGSAFIKLKGEADTAYIDIYDTYGVSFFKGSYIKLLNTSKAKDYIKNESRIEHGTRYLTGSAYQKRSERDVSLDILLEADTMADFVSRFETFMDKISSGMIYLKIPSRYRVFKLVYSDILPKQEYRNKRATFTLKLTEPNPKDRDIIAQDR